MQFTDSNARLVNVKGDFNHDGYPDMVVGTPTYTNGQIQEGSVDVYYGSRTGFATVPAFHFETNVEYGFIGSSPTVADVNGDGFPDLIVGAYNYTKPGGEPYTGAIFVFFGSANGLATQPSQVLYGRYGAMNSFFGNTIRVLGDFNRDGYADIAVSAQNHSSKGVIEVFVGSAAGLVATPQTLIWAPTGETNFGGVFDVGDTNGDGLVDIIVAKPGNINSVGGQVRIYRGSTAGPATTPTETIVDGGNGDRYGSSLAFLGDINGDGYGDIAVGAPNAVMDDVSTGEISIYYGSANGYNASPWSPQKLNGVSDEGFRGFGGYMVGGVDFNGDGYPDLIIGSDYNSLPVYASTDPFPGQIWVLPGGPNGVDLYKPLLKLAGAPGSWDALGYGALAAGDFNLDGRTDITTGARTAYAASAPFRMKIYYSLDRR